MTDRRTDRLVAVAKTALSIAARCKNDKEMCNRFTVFFTNVVRIIAQTIADRSSVDVVPISLIKCYSDVFINIIRRL